MNIDKAYYALGHKVYNKNHKSINIYNIMTYSWVVEAYKRFQNVEEAVGGRRPRTSNKLFPIKIKKKIHRTEFTILKIL